MRPSPASHPDLEATAEGDPGNSPATTVSPRDCGPGPATPQLHPRTIAGEEGASLQGRSTLLALCAASRALADAGFERRTPCPCAMWSSVWWSLSAMLQPGYRLPWAAETISSPARQCHQRDGSAQRLQQCRLGRHRHSLRPSGAQPHCVYRGVVFARCTRARRQRHPQRPRPAHAGAHPGVEVDSPAARSLLAGRRLAEGGGLPRLAGRRGRRGARTDR